MFGGAPKISTPPPPPTPFQANPATSAAQVAAAQAAGGQGFNGTIKTGMLGAAAPSTAKQSLGGWVVMTLGPDPHQTPRA